MRKYLVLATILFVLALSACVKVEINAGETTDATVGSKSEMKSKGNSKEQGLKLQVLKGDAEAGATLDNDDLYKELYKIIQENPNIGVADDFSLYIVNTIHDDRGNSKLVLFGINRLPVAIKNFEFKYTLGDKDNEFIWNKKPVTMDEEVAGILEPNSAFPVVLSITPEQEELLKSLDNDNQVMAIDDFKFEEVK